MSDLIDLREKLRDTHAEIERMQHEIGVRPDDAWLIRALRSLESRHEHLEHAFSHATAERGEEIFSYRLVREGTGSFPISILGATLTHFQHLITILLDAVITGPKERGHVSQEVTHKATMDFAYSFAGSLGLVFTVPNERLLLGESDLDLAVSGFFEMITAKTSSEVAEYARKYGVAAVRKMYAWADHHVAQAISVDIVWRRGDDVRHEAFLQAKQATILCDAIRAASDITSEEVTVRGVLVGGDLATKKFHLRFAEGEDIHGQLADDFASEDDLTLDRVYDARLTIFHKTEYAIEKEDKWYELKHMRQIQNEFNA